MNELMITNPQGSIEKATALCNYINARKLELLATANAISVTAENWNDPQTKDAIEELETAVEDLRDKGKMLVKESVAFTEAQRVITQIDSRLWNYSTKSDPNCAYAVLSSALKAIKTKVAEFKAAALPPAPAHRYAIEMLVTDADLKKVLASLNKVTNRWRYVEVDDRAEKTMDKIFGMEAK